MLGFAALTLGGILLLARFCPLMGFAGGAVKTAAAQPIAEGAAGIFTRPSMFPAMPRRYWYPSYLTDIEASRPPFPMVRPTEPIRPVFTGPQTAAQSDMPVVSVLIVYLAVIVAPSNYHCIILLSVYHYLVISMGVFRGNFTGSTSNSWGLHPTPTIKTPQYFFGYILVITGIL